MIYLGIETSCDDSSVGLYCDERKVLAGVSAAQLEHEAFGGVVPELASRVHLRNLPPVLREALKKAGLGLEDVDVLAVTEGPGLMGSLMVGVSFAMGLSRSTGLPLLGIHHIESHILANHIERDMLFPSMILVVSGGHSQVVLARKAGDYRLLAATRDDAAGEAFDKVAKIMGLGWPGGPIIEKLATGGDPLRFPFPKVRLKDGSSDYSFSGLKTAARLLWEAEGTEALAADFAASFQKAVVDQLLDGAEEAVRGRSLEAFYLAGGVAANRALLAEAESRLGRLGMPIFAPSPRYCTDNGMMVACAASFRRQADSSSRAPLSPYSRGALPGMRGGSHRRPASS